MPKSLAHPVTHVITQQALRECLELTRARANVAREIEQRRESIVRALDDHAEIEPGNLTVDLVDRVERRLTVQALTVTYGVG